MGSSPKCVHATVARMVNKKMAARVARPLWTVVWSAKTTQALFGMDLARGLKRTDLAHGCGHASEPWRCSTTEENTREKMQVIMQTGWVGWNASRIRQYNQPTQGGGLEKGGIVPICVRWNILTYVWKLSVETSAKLCYLAEWRTRWSPVCCTRLAERRRRQTFLLIFIFCPRRRATSNNAALTRCQRDLWE